MAARVSDELIAIVAARARTGRVGRLKREAVLIL
jgi:hypothetical protein